MKSTILTFLGGAVTALVVSVGIPKVLEFEVPLRADEGDLFVADTAKVLPNEMAQVADTAKVLPRKNGSVGTSGSNGQSTAIAHNEGQSAQTGGVVRATPTPTVSPLPSPSVPPPTPWPSTPTPSPSPSAPPTPTPTPIPEPTPEDTPEPTPEATPIVSPTIVINEVAWMGTDASTLDEWMELYNYGNADVEVDGWTLSAADGSPVITLSRIIAAQGYYLIERTDDTTVSGDAFQANIIYTGALSNAGEVLTLKDSAGNTVDIVGSGAWFAGTNSPKSTMERIDAASSGTEPTNWASNDGSVIVGEDALGGPIQGTPGYANSVSP